MSDDVLFAGYTIYHGPPEQPYPYFVVEWFAMPDKPIRQGAIWPARSLGAARQVMPPTADYRVPRADEDDAAIIETWL